MGIKDQYTGDELIEEKQLIAKESPLEQQLEFLLNLANNFKTITDELEEKCPQQPSSDADAFQQIYDKVQQRIPFRATHSLINACTDWVRDNTDTLLDFLDESFASEEAEARMTGYLVLPAVLIQKAYTEGANNFEINARGLHEDIPYARCLSWLKGTKENPLALTFYTDGCVEDGFEGCSWSDIKIMGGTKDDELGDFSQNCSFYHQFENVLDDMRNDDCLKNCSFYLIDKSGATIKQVG